ncbi:anoctamin-7 [Polypterus senegalus]|uniref:anoctamin-7 n=1 Tax=Polypterus senegalus TaxID=55291 RepID=UPI001963256E|nr:anoctamin-7 [Polypterus senegalus]XP_039617743.1 anoctamin-7 [Polypterus senegalus]XP_039617752.1 anoctamin-7 [Polypterus senegalus]
MQRRKAPADDSTTLIVDKPDSEGYYGSLDSKDDIFVLEEINKPQENEKSSKGMTNSNVFSDGITRIDFVLVWEVDLKEKAKEKDLDERTRQSTFETHEKWRLNFLKKLRKSGIRIEKHIVEKEKTEIHYILLNAPWSILCYYAEELSIRVPLQVVPHHASNWSENILNKISIPNIMYQDVPNPPLDFYTCQFRVSKLRRFLGSDHQETFFKSTQRHQILYEILARTPYGSLKRGEVGIDRLISENVFNAAYPLHDGPYQLPSGEFEAKSLNLRQILYQYWGRWKCWKKYQPLDHIRQYFGEKIALYFAWLGFYTGWLLPAAVVGTLVFIFGIFLMLTDIPAEEVCESGDKYIMCPLCNICGYWNLSSICTTFKAGQLFDYGGTVFFSIFMSLWAVTFLEYWKRTNAILAHHWDCSEFEETEERPRPEFTAMAPMTMRNPVTGAEEPYFPERNRMNRTITGCMVIIIMVTVVLMFLIAIILYRTILGIIIYKSKNDFFVSWAGRIASITGSVLNLLVIMLLSKLYTSLAHVLTRWEMHRTQTKYENAFILKVFIFQFINFYSSPIYIAFFKGRFIGYPGHYYTLFGIRNEDCGAGGCLIELAQELLIIMGGKQVINNVQEFVVPKLKGWWQKQKMKTRKGGETSDVYFQPWEADYQLLVCEGLFDEYLEMVLQFGFITIFVAACPIAPLFALLNNWVEIRLDAQKFVCEYRRPVVERAQSIGIWFQILEVITYLAVISNAFLIAFTSDFLPRLYYRYNNKGGLHGYINFTLAYASQEHVMCRYREYRDLNGNHSPTFFNLLAIRLGFVIIFEHVVFFIGRMIDLLVPDIPEEVEIKVKREHYMAKEALAENQALGAALLDETDAQPEVKFRSEEKQKDDLADYGLQSIIPQNQKLPPSQS